MDMTREFLEKIEEMTKPHTIENGRNLYADKRMFRINPCGPVADPLKTSTLSSIADYIDNGTDDVVLAHPGFQLIIHIASHKEVSLYTDMNDDKCRDYLILASAEVSRFPFGEFIPLEQFIINLQSCFVQDEQTASLLAFVSSVRDDTGVEQTDDGMSQKVTARSGISMVAAVNTPNPVTMRPFRTFSEVEQPASQFVFRVRKDERAGVTAALFSADGDAWKHTAISTIWKYFKDTVKDKAIILA